MNKLFLAALLFANAPALGCGCQVCAGTIPVITGNAQVANAFNAMSGVFIMPVVNSFSVSAQIVGFVFVKLISSAGTGSHWTATLQLLTAPLPVNELTADSDGDGMSDFHEYHAGTSPTNSASLFGVTGLASEGGDLRIRWTTAPGRTNALLRSDNPSANFTSIAVITTSTVVTNYLDLGTATNSAAQFYRVRLVP